jgi:hypothetical protein
MLVPSVSFQTSDCLRSLIFDAIFKRGGPVISRTPNQPLHVMSRLMSPTGSFMNLVQELIRLSRSQALEQ